MHIVIFEPIFQLEHAVLLLVQCFIPIQYIVGLVDVIHCVEVKRHPRYQPFPYITAVVHYKHPKMPIRSSFSFFPPAGSSPGAA